MSIAINKASADVYHDFKNGINTLVYVYYAGHGVMDNTTYCVLNGAKMYPLEKMLRSFAKADGSYILAVFDCCREKLLQAVSRGLGAGQEFDEDSPTLGAPIDCQENLIMTFGCRPSDGVPAKSTIATNYFKYMRRSANKLPTGDRVIVLPGCLNFFQNWDGKCEHAIKTARPVLLDWTDDPKGKMRITLGQKFFQMVSDHAAAMEEEQAIEELEQEAQEDEDEALIDQEIGAQLAEEDENAGEDFFDFT